MAKPFLRWAGSKRQLLGRLVKYWPGEDTRYVEPFAGSACLFFELEPSSALIGDKNADLMSTYRIVRENPSEVYHSMVQWRNDKAQYYRVRELDSSSLSPVECAARFIYLNKYCFNGLYRTNGRGDFNVPYGGEKSGALPDVNILTYAAQLLSHADLVCGDFEDIMSNVTAGDFVYLDPPFVITDRRAFTEYSSQPFEASDLPRLRATLERIDMLGATFLLSYADSDEGRLLADGYESTMVCAKRSIAGRSDSRRTEKEIIATNVKIPT